MPHLKILCKFFQHHLFLSSEEIKKVLHSSNLSFDVAEVIVTKIDFHGGLGLDQNPMNKIMFYSKYSKDKTRHIIKETNDNVSSVFVFAPHTCTTEDVITMTVLLEQHAKANNISPPNRLFKNNGNEF